MSQVTSLKKRMALYQAAIDAGVRLLKDKESRHRIEAMELAKEVNLFRKKLFVAQAIDDAVDELAQKEKEREGALSPGFMEFCRTGRFPT